MRLDLWPQRFGKSRFSDDLISSALDRGEPVVLFDKDGGRSYTPHPSGLVRIQRLDRAYPPVSVQIPKFWFDEFTKMSEAVDLYRE